MNRVRRCVICDIPNITYVGVESTVNSVDRAGAYLE